MNLIIKIIFILSITNLSIALESIKNNNVDAEENNTQNHHVDLDDAITQEINNYNSNIASETLDDEHDSNNDINPGKTKLLPEQEIKQDLKYALITIVNKITTKSENFSLEINNVYEYKNINLKALSCQKSTNGTFEDRALIKITEKDVINNQYNELFAGWLLAKSSLTSMSHPIYDITLNECNASKK